MDLLNIDDSFFIQKNTMIDNIKSLYSVSLSFSRWQQLAVRKFAPPSRTFAPMTSASWDLYLETLNFPTLTVMVNQLKFQGPSSPRTKPTRNPHLPNLSYPLLPNALTSMQEPSSPSPSSSSMSSTGLSTCERESRVKVKWFVACCL